MRSRFEGFRGVLVLGLVLFTAPVLSGCQSGPRLAVDLEEVVVGVRDSTTAHLTAAQPKDPRSAREKEGEGGPTYEWRVTDGGGADPCSFPPDAHDTSADLTVGRRTPGWSTISVECFAMWPYAGGGFVRQCAGTAKIKVVAIGIQYYEPGKGYVDIVGPFIAMVGTTVRFRVVPLDAGEAVWGGTIGATGTGTYKDVTITESGDGNLSVTVTRGGTAAVGTGDDRTQTAPQRSDVRAEAQSVPTRDSGDTPWAAIVSGLDSTDTTARKAAERALVAKGPEMIEEVRRLDKPYARRVVQMYDSLAARRPSPKEMTEAEYSRAFGKMEMDAFAALRFFQEAGGVRYIAFGLRSQAFLVRVHACAGIRDFSIEERKQHRRYLVQALVVYLEKEPVVVQGGTELNIYRGCVKKATEMAAELAEMDTKGKEPKAVLEALKAWLKTH